LWLLGGSSLAAAQRRWQRGGGAQRDGSLQLGGGSLVAADWRQRQRGGSAQRNGGGSLGGVAAAAAWRRRGGIGSAVAALSATAAAA
jgi:hypothetical protein